MCEILNSGVSVVILLNIVVVCKLGRKSLPFRAANLMRIRELILVMICVASTTSLIEFYLVIVMVAIKFDSCKLEPNCTPASACSPFSLPLISTKILRSR